VGDVFRVDHVISNLLSNVIKFSQQDGTIPVKVVAQAFTGSQASTFSTSITVSISDEVPGIYAEN
jgi:signal transduction histidine kinase